MIRHTRIITLYSLLRNYEYEYQDTKGQVMKGVQNCRTAELQMHLSPMEHVIWNMKWNMEYRMEYGGPSSYGYPLCQPPNLTAFTAFTAHPIPSTPPPSTPPASDPVHFPPSTLYLHYPLLFSSLLFSISIAIATSSPTHSNSILHSCHTLSSAVEINR